MVLIWAGVAVATELLVTAISISGDGHAQVSVRGNGEKGKGYEDAGELRSCRMPTVPEYVHRG